MVYGLVVHAIAFSFSRFPRIFCETVKLQADSQRVREREGESRDFQNFNKYHIIEQRS